MEELHYLGKGVQWRTSGERLTCRGEGASRHRPKLLRVIHAERVIPLEQEQEASPVIVLTLQCPECGERRFAFADDVAPCGEPSPASFPVRAETPLNVLQMALANGKSERHWQQDPPGRCYIYKHPRHEGIVQAPYETEDPAFMMTLIRAQDADSVLIAWNVIAHLLEQDEGRTDLPSGMTPAVLLDIYDLARRTGLIRKKTRQEVQRGMRKAWDALRALERYRVYSAGKAIDPETRREVQTQIEAPVIAFGSTERAAQQSLWREADVPIAQEVSLTRQWYLFLRDARYAIYCDGGGELAKLPASQPAGAWARSIGMLLLQQFRLNGAKPVHLSRAYLLTRLPPAVKPVEELLADVKHKARAGEYWNRAMRLLVRVQILQTPPEDDRPANGDWDAWLSHTLTFVPGTLPVRSLTKACSRLQTGNSRLQTGESRLQTGKIRS